jgi:hypothetical protein
MRGAAGSVFPLARCGTDTHAFVDIHIIQRSGNGMT